MGSKTVDRFFSLSDNNFIEDVNDDLEKFVIANRPDSVLVFPPVSNYRRFLIHKCVEQVVVPKLSTFSIGVGDERRTVVCYPQCMLSDVAGASTKMGLSQSENEGSSITECGAEGEPKPETLAQRPPRSQEKSRSKPRRPDRAVYVPRALRGADPPAEDDTSRKRSIPTSTPTPSPKSPRDKSVSGTPRKDRGFCNVYTPPPLRNHLPHSTPVSTLTNCDTAIQYSDDNVANDEQESFFIGEYFTNGQLGLYTPSLCYSGYTSAEDNRLSDTDNRPEYYYETEWRQHNNMADTQGDVINGYLNCGKDEDFEKTELKRASREMNRSTKRIIKQTFDSDVLVISEPVDEPNINSHNEPNDIVNTPKMKPKLKLEPKVSLKREENDWDAVFDESGECLDPSLLEELTATVGKVHITKAKNNYDGYQTKGQALFNGNYDENFGHVVEVYDFPSEFKTNDLLSVFSDYKDTGFEIKWVDDTHALICFSSSKIAAEVLSTQTPLVKCRPLYAATLESRNKAKKCAEFLQPYRQRPETCTALARRLVSGALGVKLSTASQERAEERRLITLAREKKRQAALHKEAAWDGSLANQSLGDT